MAKKKKEIIEEEEENTRTDEEVLLEGPVTVSTSQGDFEVKPWTFGSYHSVAHLLENMISDLVKRKIDPQLLFTRMAFVTYVLHVDIPASEGRADDLDPEFTSMCIDEFNKENVEVARLFAACTVHAREIILKTCDITEEQIDALEAQEALRLFATIVTKNPEVLKNAFGLFEPVI